MDNLEVYEIWPQERIQKHHPNGVRPTKIPRHPKSHPKKGRCQQIVTADFSPHFHGFRSWVLLRGRFFSGYLNGMILFHTFSSVCFFLFWQWFWIFWGVFVWLLFLFVWISKKEREVCFGGTNNYLATKWLVTCEICHWDVTLGSRINAFFGYPDRSNVVRKVNHSWRLVSGWSGVFNPVRWLLLVPITETFVGVWRSRALVAAAAAFLSILEVQHRVFVWERVRCRKKQTCSRWLQLYNKTSQLDIYSSLKHHSCHEVSHMFPANFHFHSFVANKKTGSAWVCPNRTRRGEATGRFSLHVARPYFVLGEWFPVVFFRCGTFWTGCFFFLCFLGSVWWILLMMYCIYIYIIYIFII